MHDQSAQKCAELIELSAPLDMDIGIVAVVVIGMAKLFIRGDTVVNRVETNGDRYQDSRGDAEQKR